MRPNPLFDIWKRDQAVLNGWVSVPSGYFAEVIAHQGWDSVTVDMQHGAVDFAGSMETMTAICTTAAVPMVRVSWLDEALLMRALDAGAYGLICPMINTAAEAERFVAATRYPPLGGRSHGPMRGLLYGGADYPQHANAAIVRLAMIETAAGLENIEAICQVEGLTGVYVGPSDLGNGLGTGPAPIPTDPKTVAAVKTIVDVARKHGKIAGMHCATPDHALAMIADGYRFVSVSTDIRLMIQVSQDTLRPLRAGLA